MDLTSAKGNLNRISNSFLTSIAKNVLWGRVLLFLFVSLFLFSSCLPTRRVTAPYSSYTEMKIGQLKPKDTGTGPMAGLSMGKRIDNRLWWGFEGSFFKSSFTRATTVPDTVLGNTIVSTKRVELDYTTTILSFFINLSYELRFDPTSRFYYRASAGLGWEFIWNKEKNYVDNVSRTRSFNTPGLQFTTGLGLGISQTGLVFLDLVYNMATARSGTIATEGGLPTFQEIDITGLGFRVGVNIWDIGFFRP